VIGELREASFGSRYLMLPDIGSSAMRYKRRRTAFATCCFEFSLSCQLCMYLYENNKKFSWGVAGEGEGEREKEGACVMFAPHVSHLMFSHCPPSLPLPLPRCARHLHAPQWGCCECGAVAGKNRGAGKPWPVPGQGVLNRWLLLPAGCLFCPLPLSAGR
jgi:hypothetical protein